MPIIPPKPLRESVHEALKTLLSDNPMATSSESFVQHYVEFALLGEAREPRYYLRIGINYRGGGVQHVLLDKDGTLIGWNPNGDPLGTASDAKVLLSGVTIFPRDRDEQLKSDTKVGGGDIPAGLYVRAEFKVRGWLGKTKNLDGSQLEKDIDLVKSDRADLLVICLSETAHLKWRGGGPSHQAGRRIGTGRFAQLLVDPTLVRSWPTARTMTFEGQEWATTTDCVIGSATSSMPGAIHYVTLAWRTETVITPDVKPSA